MSRLDVFVARMTAQAKCLNWAAEVLGDLPGPVFELGLGNGRTYDHLREQFDDREIFVFERKIACHPSCLPPDDYLILGDVIDTLVEAKTRFGGKVALMHADIGGHDLGKNDVFARRLSPLLQPLMRPAGLIVSTDRFYVESWQTLPLPPGVDCEQGFLYRA